MRVAQTEGDKMKRTLIALLLALLIAVPAFAAESVNAYTTLEEPLAAALFAKFEEETGIHVNFVRLSGGEAVARLQAEASNPQASIWVGGVGLDHITAKGMGLTEPYVSRYSRNTPSQYRDPDNYWIGLYVGPLTFVTNLDRAAELGLEVPHSWADLLDPSYKGYIRMANPNSSGTAYNVLTTMIYVLGTEDAMMEYATGEIPIAIGYAHDQVKLKDAGANIEITAPEEGTGFELASMSIVKNGPDPVNAKKLYDWIISDKDAQDIFTQWYVVLVANGAPTHPNALSINDIKTVDQDFAWDGDPANKDRILNRWTTEIGNKRG